MGMDVVSLLHYFTLFSSHPYAYTLVVSHLLPHLLLLLVFLLLLLLAPRRYTLILLSACNQQRT